MLRLERSDLLALNIGINNDLPTNGYANICSKGLHSIMVHHTNSIHNNLSFFIDWKCLTHRYPSIRRKEWVMWGFHPLKTGLCSHDRPTGREYGINFRIQLGGCRMPNAELKRSVENMWLRLLACTSSINYNSYC